MTWRRDEQRHPFYWPGRPGIFRSFRPRQNGRQFPDDIFKCIFFNENMKLSIKISLKFVPKGPISNIPALVKIMALRRSGDKPLLELMMVILLAHICVTRPQWIKKSPTLSISAATFVIAALPRTEDHKILYPAALRMLRITAPRVVLITRHCLKQKPLILIMNI